jgi:hypothetical protein
MGLASGWDGKRGEPLLDPMCGSGTIPIEAALIARGIAPGLERQFQFMRWPALLKPDQGGSGARIQVVESFEHVEAIFSADPTVWFPDNLFLLQEYLPHDPDRGIVRLEFLGGELLYAMRVVTHGRFNLCPSPVCNPDTGDARALPAAEPRRRWSSSIHRRAGGRGDRAARSCGEA